MADGGRSERATETTLPTCLFCSVKQNRKPLTDEATRSRVVYRKHGCNLGNTPTASIAGVSQRLPISSLIFQFICNKTSHLICPLVASRPRYCSFLSPVHFSCLSVTKDQCVWPHAKLSLSLSLCSTSSLHPLLLPASYCRILALSPVRSDPRYLLLSVVSLEVADVLQLNKWHIHTFVGINSGICTNTSAHTHKME